MIVCWLFRVLQNAVALVTQSSASAAPGRVLPCWPSIFGGPPRHVGLMSSTSTAVTVSVVFGLPITSVFFDGQTPTISGLHRLLFVLLLCLLRRAPRAVSLRIVRPDRSSLDCVLFAPRVGVRGALPPAPCLVVWPRPVYFSWSFQPRGWAMSL